MKAFVSLVLTLSHLSTLCAGDLTYSASQLTHGPKHHFFGYIGQSLTIPWNQSGRFILCLETDFHDHMPRPNEPAQVCVVDTKDGNRIIPLDESRAYNFQQGTMFYWNPASAEHQFFFNDRDPDTGKVFTVLYDLDDRKRVHEYRFEETPVGNSGVAPNGESFLAINYARMDRLRPVTGYPEAFDWTVDQTASSDDGIFLVDIESGSKTLLVSFQELRDRFIGRIADVDKASLYINHTLWNRNSDRIYFFLRGRLDGKAMWVNTPCSIHPDGTNLTLHETFIGGHPEWGEGNRVIGRQEDRQVVYDVDRKQIVDEIGQPGDFPNPEGDISFSPDGRFLVNGFGVPGGKNDYVIFRMEDGTHIRTESFSRGPYRSGELRIDPAPRWNRESNRILIPNWCEDDTRQMFILSLSEN
ncbi:MAG: hypothetical protein KC944_07555 [Candidatus Omnitrophica bacterium]|nr:hypothetical protein [Candidatus Omnitrophota bacterium]